MAAATLAAEALLHRAGVATGHRQADQVAERGLDVRALCMREGLHVGGRVDDGHVGAADDQTKIHEVEVARRVLAAGPGPLVVQGPHHGEVLAALVHLHGDGTAVNRVLLGIWRGTQRGEGGWVLRHRLILSRGCRRVPPQPR